MKNTIVALFMLVAIQFAAMKVKAQADPHFTQYYVYPAWLNPSLTGAFDGDYRVSAIYRTQWGNVSGPFSTFGVSGDISTGKNANFGVSVLNQSAGDGGYNYTTGYGSFSYSGVKLGPAETHRLVFGLQLGFIQRKFNPSKLTFGDQWNPITGYNPGNASRDGLTRNTAASFDASAGVLYYDAQPGKKYNIFGGFSVSHLTRPQDQFSTKGDARFPLRFTGHAGIRMVLSDKVSLTPNILYMKQGSAQEKMVGAYAQVLAAPGTDLMLGANYRFEDALSPYVGFTYKGMMIGASYDINTSDLGKIANGSNSFEISISFIGRRKARTPEVEFVCPRL
ncbi:PorP/SprF family type IX secretion system membrane protein [Chitinophaga pendula]|uniref:PorP/SprF family type IX secretion system membrane protein n=1 Tax=Chitinophaga TaxID=79328 RepID=UPI000BAFA821|nr:MULTISPECIES: PorP/SprF family type IX secretion system membrane protein [Chitinophaga]ASZ14220.1 hypothetical protein CK934_26350 [Chitinophaga sp. MD30]UCJ08140.1 PorP/SprF family type IX secretion system membrane protein [Chitinophaga pendula]